MKLVCTKWDEAKRTDLAEYKCIEDESAVARAKVSILIDNRTITREISVLELILVVNLNGRIARGKSEDGTSSEMENERNDRLIDSLSDDHHPHLRRDQRRKFSIRSTFERCTIGGVGSESKSSESTGKKRESIRLELDEVINNGGAVYR